MIRLPGQKTAIEEIKLKDHMSHVVEALSCPTHNGPMQTFRIPLSSVLFDEAVTFIFTFQVPEGFDAKALHAKLTEIVQRVIPRDTESLNKLMTKDKFNPNKVTDIELSNLMEYILVPPVGDAAYRANVPAFRYNVQLRRMFNHDVEIGQVIPEDERYNPR
jgi:hypothetical protein